MDELDGKSYKFWGQEVEIGIDEAGRGPVLGPMVYGAAFWPADPKGNKNHSKEMKKRFGFADSKQLSEPQRERIYAQMKEEQFETIGFFPDVLSAQMLSHTMLADWDKGGRNLNKISHDSAIGLIKKIRDTLGFKVKRVFLDTVGAPEKYKKIVQDALRDDDIQVTVESKADDTYPIVSAASICAKVTRDHALRDYVYPEAKDFNREVGCGYPGDKITKKWLVDNMDPVFGFPSIVRFSWKTSYALLEKDDIKAEWHDMQQSVADGTNKTEIKKIQEAQLQREQQERSRLSDHEKQRRMNVATHRLNIRRGFEEF